MNLADIRKKAQRDRREREAAALPGAAGRGGCMPPPLPGAVPEEAPPDLQRGTPKQTPVELFDPLGMILAGRDAVSAAPVRDDVPAPGPEESLSAFLSFDAGSETYAVAIDRVKEIIRPRRITPVPRAPVFIKGILSHRGAIIPVLDLTTRLGFGARLHAGTERIVVLRKGGGVCGSLVDGVGRVVMLPATAVEPAPVSPAGGNSEFVSGIARHRGKLMVLLNLDKVLDIGWHST